MEHSPDNTETMKITCSKLNRLFGDLSEGEGLPQSKRSPFAIVDTNIGPVIAIDGDDGWDVATVLEKVLNHELPRGSGTFHRPYDTTLPVG